MTILEGPHPIPFRIRSLSPPRPMVLIPQGIGRVGSRRAFSFWPLCGQKEKAPPVWFAYVLHICKPGGATTKNPPAARIELPFFFWRILAHMGFTAPLRSAQRAGHSLGRQASLASLRSAPCPLSLAYVPLTPCLATRPSINPST